MKRIIVVEDDMITQQFYSMFFNKNGFNVTVTDDGDKILDTLFNEDVGLILMDINLSNTYLNGIKTDGIKLAQIIKSNEEFKNIPVVLVTAYSLSSQVKNLLNETKAVDIISKPILDYNRFLKKINTLIAN
ncbi:MAG: response regulator [Ignavibacteriota bacterium]|jgi:CheY-like chemotaxis protein|nr:MAG: response regulator [Ignavibacterium sp.]MBL1153682.1 response regulator [Ignavibacteriota bacterium]MCO6448187.1 response regulator [Ignavibacterium album]MCZ2267970.1 response regulator [Ignavibacteriales bacterium]MDX9711398.1 response regulator [Ignavibacteriaceae bacterium]